MLSTGSASRTLAHPLCDSLNPPSQTAPPRLPRGRPNSCFSCSVPQLSWRELYTRKKFYSARLFSDIDWHLFIGTHLPWRFLPCIGLGVCSISTLVEPWLASDCWLLLSFIRNSERFSFLASTAGALLFLNRGNHFGYLTPLARLCTFSSSIQWLAPHGYRMLSQADRDLCKRFFFISFSFLFFVTIFFHLF